MNVNKKRTIEDFINESREVHGEKYDYSKFVYLGTNVKGIIICPIHGEFELEPKLHIHKKRGCKYCTWERLSKEYSMSKDEFIDKARKVHGNKYDYSKVEYINNKTKVCIICREHGEFWQTPNEHLQGRGCYECSVKKNSDKKFLTTEEFIEKAKLVHGDKYDYSKVDYKGSHENVIIICPKHGKFEQEACSHLQGKGCHVCNESSLEREIRIFLINNNILFKQYCKNDTLPFLKRLTLDFYLPNFNIGIECQGEEHFKPITFFGGLEKYKKTIERDDIKKKLCDDNNVKLLYYSNLKIDYPYKVFTDKNKLLENIIYNETNKNN